MISRYTLAHYFGHLTLLDMVGTRIPGLVDACFVGPRFDLKLFKGEGSATHKL